MRKDRIQVDNACFVGVNDHVHPTHTMRLSIEGPNGEEEKHIKDSTGWNIRGADAALICEAMAKRMEPVILGRLIRSLEQNLIDRLEE